MAALTVYVEGIGVWAPGIADWDAMRRALDGDEPLTFEANTRPSPTSLPPTERRRAPEPVLLASEVAGQACAMAGRAAASLASVFASARGDLAITDAMCATLAGDPRELSPTRFHNSVHNAPAGYWTVATHCHERATAISAADASFAAGLLEAAVEVAAEREPVLFCAYDVAAQGPLAEVAPSSLPFASALVLSATRSDASLAELSLRALDTSAKPSVTPPSLAALEGNPTAKQALGLLAAIASRTRARATLARARATSLDIEVAP